MIGSIVVMLTKGLASNIVLELSKIDIPAFAWCHEPVKTYHSLRTAKDNEEILRLLDEDPMCQVIVLTVAFANGLNAKSLLDGFSLGFPDTMDQMWQEKGRVGRDPDSSARGVVFY
ncbi:hypothetical protein DFH08DRAFT_823206 [Mycena albidolilacea]|uniref:Helicase C-terminal domain-containing protein n=1 Tax=Mycena albidolilacea TaxID=1033008 RepID=A0AAD7EBK2_9AGAR|nr:hypothetical protein DFH08DRAFT_823206 [Mycena albidolilacea]